MLRLKRNPFIQLPVAKWLTVNSSRLKKAALRPRQRRSFALTTPGHQPEPNLRLLSASNLAANKFSTLIRFNCSKLLSNSFFFEFFTCKGELLTLIYPQDKFQTNVKFLTILILLFNSIVTSDFCQF